jgi:hypothetical protein
MSKYIWQRFLQWGVGGDLQSHLLGLATVQKLEHTVAGPLPWINSWCTVPVF